MHPAIVKHFLSLNIATYQMKMLSKTSLESFLPVQDLWTTKFAYQWSLDEKLYQVCLMYKHKKKWSLVFFINEFKNKMDNNNNYTKDVKTNMH